MKYLFIAILLFAIISNAYSKEELLLQHEQMIIDNGNKSFLYDEHYFICNITETGQDTTSVLTREDGFSAFNTKLSYTECVSTSNNGEVFFAMRTVFNQNEHIYYIVTVNSVEVTAVILEEAKIEKSMPDQKEVIAMIYEHANVFISLAKAILQQEISKEMWLCSVCSLQKMFPSIVVANATMERATTVLKTWKMTKTSSGNDSIYIDMGKNKILDYTLVITEKSNGVLIARINATILGDSMLKIYPVQISHYGKTYWIKGNVTIVYQ